MRGSRDRIADPAEAATLIAAAHERDRALWATAMYAGLRVGKLRALRAGSIDLASGLIHVERAWDEKEGEISPKSSAGRRRVPVAAVLRDHLVEQAMAGDRGGDELAFGRTATAPLPPRRPFRIAPTRRGRPPASGGLRSTSAAIRSPR